GIPKLEIRIPDYYRLPFWGGLISLKGNFAHGWVGSQLQDHSLFLIPSEDYHVNTFYHQKSLYGRIGREKAKLNLYGGINHQAYWGNEKDMYGDVFTLSALESFMYVFLGKPYSSEQIGSSKLGNQLGSIDLGASLTLKNIRLMGYRQNFYDIGAISKLANIRDGLNGLVTENLNYRKEGVSSLDWKKFLIEFFYSKDQAGYPWSKRTASGDEDYYNNSYYRNGWTYKGTGIGNPLIISANDAKAGQVSNPLRYFISNRVSALHLGTELYAWKTSFIVKATYAKHFGNFSTSRWGASLGEEFREPYGIFKPVDQFSGYVKAYRDFRRGFSMGLVVSADYGSMLNNSFGSYVSLAKQW